MYRTMNTSLTVSLYIFPNIFKCDGGLSAFGLEMPYLTAIIEHGYGRSSVNVPIQNPRLFQKSASKRVKNLHFGVPMSYLCRSNSA